MRIRLVTLSILASAMTACGASWATASTSDRTGASTSDSAVAPGTVAAGAGGVGLTARIEAICARHNLAATSTPITNETPVEAQTDAKKRAAIEQTTLAELDALRVPTSMQPAWSQFLSYRRSLVAAFQRLAAATPSHSGHEPYEEVELTEPKMHAAAKRDHLTECTLEY